MSSKTQLKDALTRSNQEITRLKGLNEVLTKNYKYQVDNLKLLNTNLQKEVARQKEEITKLQSRKKWYEFWK